MNGVPRSKNDHSNQVHKSIWTPLLVKSHLWKPAERNHLQAGDGSTPFGTQEVLPALLPLPGRESAEELSQTSRQPLSNPKIRDYVETVKLCTLFTIPLLSCLKGELRGRESRASKRSTGCPLERKEGKQYKTTTQSKAATLAYLGAVPGKGGFPSVCRSCLPALPQRTRLPA